MLTGRYGHHTGVVDLEITLPTTETTLFEAIPQQQLTSGTSLGMTSLPLTMASTTLMASHIEAGVSIPMVIAGRGVSQESSRCDTAINAVDIFPTVLELAGVKTTTDDSVSAASLLSGSKSSRKYLFSEILNKRSGHMYAISNREYKIIATKGEPTMFFNLTKDPLEQCNLLDGALSKRDQKNFGTLLAELSQMNIPIIVQSQGNRPLSNYREKNTNRFR